jgi:hypothetical protein
MEQLDKFHELIGEGIGFLVGVTAVFFLYRYLRQKQKRLPG